MSTIESAQSEKRLFPPSGAFVQQAHLDSEGLRVLHDEASADPGAFWLRQAEQLSWRTRPTQGLDDSQHPFVRWFADGRLNLTESCLDRHLLHRKKPPSKPGTRGSRLLHPHAQAPGGPQVADDHEHDAGKHV